LGKYERNGHKQMNEPEFLTLCRTKFGGTRYPMTKNMNMVELVALVTESAAEIAKKLLESRLEEDPRCNPTEPVCSQCNGKLRIQESKQRRGINTALGEIEYRRAYGVCDRCGHTAAPLDEALGIPVFGPSVEALQKICHAAVVGRSFEDGREILSVQARIQISAKHVRSIAETEGRRLADYCHEETAAYREGRLKVEGAQAPELLVVAADGGRVQTRTEKAGERWREDKIGIVYDAQAKPQAQAEPDEYEGASALTKTYAATMENWETLGWMLRLEAERRGYGGAKGKVFIADGAKHIRELKDLQFPEAVFILDWAHAVQHLSDCGKAVFGEGSADYWKWYEKHKQLLWKGRSEEIIRNLLRLSQRMGLPEKDEPETSPRRTLYQNAYSYFPNNRDAINYPYFRSQGWPLGSGVAEGAIKQFSLRLKGSEKFWNIAHNGAEEMLALCALYHSEDGRWDSHWRKRAQPR
jgi:RNA polymerase-binding transcription factor DksA